MLARDCQAQSLGERSSRSLPGNDGSNPKEKGLSDTEDKRKPRSYGHASALLTSLAPSPRPKLVYVAGNLGGRG